VKRPNENQSVWRQRDFRIAWTATFVNDSGDWVLNVALPVFVFVETGSGSATALLFVCQLLVGAVLGLIPRLVDTDRLTSANAALASSTSLARLIGAPLGGVVVAWGGLGPVVALDSLSFLAAASALALVRADTSPVAGPAGHERATIRGGLRIAREHHPLPALLTLHGCASIAQGGFVVLFVTFVVRTLDDDGAALGLIRGMMAIGALIGAAVIARVAKRVDSLLLYSTGLIGMGCVSLLFWNAPHVTIALAAYVGLFALSGVPGAALSVRLLTSLQTFSPTLALGRVAGLLGTAEAAGIAVGSIAVGALIDHVSLSILLDVQAGIYIIAGLAAATVRHNHRRTPALAATTPSGHSNQVDA
jgi:predicted MFS family arabinose efflux permease